MVFLMGNAYYLKYITILRAGIHLENKVCPDSEQPLFCRTYSRWSHLPVYIFQAISVPVLIAFAWNQGASSLWLIGVSILMFLVFVYIFAMDRALREIRHDAKP